MTDTATRLTRIRTEPHMVPLFPTRCHYPSASTLMIVFAIAGLASCTNTSKNAETGTATAAGQDSAAPAAAPNRPRLLPGDTIPYTAEDKALIERMRRADVDALKAFVQQVLDEEVPADYPLPEVLKTAGSPQAAELRFQERYPEFYGTQGATYLRAVAQSPVRYRQMIHETRAVRRFYQKSNN